MTNFSLTSSKFSGSSLRIFTVLFIQVCVEHGNMLSIFSIFCLEQIKEELLFHDLNEFQESDRCTIAKHLVSKTRSVV